MNCHHTPHMREPHKHNIEPKKPNTYKKNMQYDSGLINLQKWATLNSMV